MIFETIGIAAIAAVGIFTVGKQTAQWYRVVPTSEAHLLTNRAGMSVFASGDVKLNNVSKGNAYFAFPQGIPYLGCQVRKIDLAIQEVYGKQIAYEKGQARFYIDWNLKYKIVDVMKAATTSKSSGELREMLKAPIESAVNAITPNYDVTVLRSSKIKIQEEIEGLLVNDLAAWGLELVSFQLGDFNDTSNSSVISDISKRTEAKINAETRIQVADQKKAARVKEAEADETASKREIAKDSIISQEKEMMKQQIAEQSKETKTKEAEVTRIQTVMAAEIAKEKAIVEADTKNMMAEKRKIEMEKNGEAEKLKTIQIAEAGKVATIAEAEAEARTIELQAEADAKSIELIGTAEADTKIKLAEAMKQFDEAAVYAMTAEKQIEANKEIGIASAEALGKADVKAFVGGGKGGKFAFDIAGLIESFATANPDACSALLNRLAKPNDRGINISD